MPLINQYPDVIRDVDYIVPFPYGSNIELDAAGNPAPRLSLLSRMAIDAGVEVWRHNNSARLVLIGETPYPEGLPNTTDLMIERARKLDVPDSAVVPLHKLPDGTYLNNTNLQAEAARDYINGQGDDAETLTIALNYHEARVKMANQALSLASRYVTAETVLYAAGKLGPYEKYLPYISELEPSERALRLLGRVDKRGRLVNFLARRMGARMVDVIEDDNGDIIVEKTTAAKKLKQLTAGR